MFCSNVDTALFTGVLNDSLGIVAGAGVVVIVSGTGAGTGSVAGTGELNAVFGIGSGILNEGARSPRPPGAGAVLTVEPNAGGKVKAIFPPAEAGAVPTL